MNISLTRDSINRLRKILGELLIQQGAEIWITEDLGCPLLVLETSDDAVGFAVINGTPQLSYESAYGSFKQLYGQKHDYWKDQNLSFVICRSDNEISNDAFYRTLEADMYFCRKYVIRFGSDHAAIKDELLQLPFTPLPKDSMGGVRIPPSAQSLLQSINVPAPIAYRIVTPGESSASTIIQDLLSEEEQLPVLQRDAIIDNYQRAGVKESARITNISITAFRAYRKRQELDLDADVIILYGPNGFGKTSFFDAVDFACTGRIGRFCRNRIGAKEFASIARHLDAPEEAGMVSMQIGKKSKKFLVRRKISDWSSASIGKEKHSRASLIEFLTSAEWGSKRPHISYLESLFRSTHLFSQTDQELMTSFDRNSTLDNDIVSRMLALDDYSSALKKVAEIQNQFSKRLLENANESTALKDEMDDLNIQRKSLPEEKDSERAGDQIKKMASELVKQLESEINMQFDSSDLSQDSVREWRALVESALQSANDNLRKLKRIKKGFTSYSKKRTDLEKRTAEHGKLENELNARSAVYKREQAELKKLIRRLRQSEKVLKLSNARILVLSELPDLQEVVQKTNNSIRRMRKDLVRVANEREVTGPELQNILPAFENLQIRQADIQDEIQSSKKTIGEFNHVLEGLPSWKKNQTIISDIEKSISTRLQSLETAKNAINELEVGIKGYERELKSCEKKLGDLSHNEAALTQLLDELETHIQDGICPVCGTEHASKKSLIGRIRSQKQVRPANVEKLISNRGQLRKAIEEEKAALEIQTRLPDEINSKLNEMETQLSEVRESVSVYESAVIDAGLPPDQYLEAALGRKIAEKMKVRKSLQNSQNKLQGELDTAIQKIKGLERKLSQQEKKRKRAEREIEHFENQIAEIQEKVDEHDLLMDMSPEEIAEETKKAQARKTRALDRIHDLSPQVETSTQATSELESEIGDLTEEIETIRQSIFALEDKIGRYEEKAAAVLGRRAIDLDVISRDEERAIDQVDRLEDLRNRSLTLERATDASQRSVMLAELKAKSEAITKKLNVLSAAAHRIDELRKWFTIVESTLEKQNSSAIANYVRAFGPLTTVIQSRLRDVYGFEDVRLDARGGEINIRVRRKGEQHKPADYFSDSQKQILMLSIFLAARITQTWSGFAPIMLDDPVTHFDDLNAFGFVEFMRGVMNTTPGERQFFISTCEERLFDLMVKKYNGIDGGAKFYRFKDIGPGGPVIAEITP